jgi:hypothetical protein
LFAAFASLRKTRLYRERGSNTMRIRTLWIGAAVVGALTALVLAAGAATGRAGSPDVSFTLTGSPGQVTQGGTVGYSGTITNNGSQTVTHLTLVESVPNATLAFKAFSRSVTCSPVTGGVLTCDLGNLAGHGTITFTKVYTTPSTGSSVVDTSFVQFDERANDSNHSKQDTRCANTGSDKPCAPSVTTPLVSSGNSDFFGGFVAFGGNGAQVGTNPNLSHSNSESTQTTIPFRTTFSNGVGVTILERPQNFVGEDCPAGFSCTGLVHDVTVPGGFPTSTPLVITFGIPDTTHGHGLNLFHDGSGPLPLCSVVPVSPSSPACIQSATPDGSGNLIVVVQSLTNGSWRFGSPA